MRLIDADEIREKAVPHAHDHRGYSADIRKWAVLVGDIDDAPTIEAEPVKHGKWVDHCIRDWHCSECGKKVPRQVYFDGYCYKDKLNYCPNCGAKMDGGEAE